MSLPKILIVEDEPTILDALQYHFLKENFDVTTATNGREAIQKAELQFPDIVILDLMIPPPDGMQVCRQLKNDSRFKHTRILILTAKDDEIDEVLAFNMGADDYVAKPFRVKPLVERVKALMRRPVPTEAEQAETLKVDGIEIDRAHHVVRLNGDELPLTLTEFRLLWTLARRPGRTFKRTELLDCCRGEDANSMERTIDVHIRALRKKLLDHADQIETIRGIGYRYKARNLKS